MEERRDYNVNDFTALEDKRFLYAKQDAIFAQILCFAAIILEMAAAYGLCPKDLSQMTYILGFPTWFVVASGIAFVAFIIALVYTTKISKNVSLKARAEETEVDE